MEIGYDESSQSILVDPSGAICTSCCAVGETWRNVWAISNEEGPSLLWYKYTGQVTVYDVCVDRTGNIIVVGTVNENGYFAWKWTGAGTEVWKLKIRADNCYFGACVEVGYGVVANADDDIYFAVSQLNCSLPPSEVYPALYKYDKNKNELWSYNFDDSASGCTAFSVCLDISGNVYAGAVIASSCWRTQTAKLQPDGTKVWRTTSGWSDYEDGFPVVLSYPWGGCCDYNGNFWTAVDRSKNIWGYCYESTIAGVTLHKQSKVDGSNLGHFEVGRASRGITIDHSGNLIVTGRRIGDKSLWKLDSSGSEIWSKDTGGDTWHSTTDAAGNIYVCGNRANGKSFWKYSSGGTLLWSYDTGGRTYSCSLGYTPPFAEWDVGHGTYYVDDVVSNNNKLYICILEHVASAGKEPPNPLYWTEKNQDTIYIVGNRVKS
ncbi:MAG: hypothetical protein DRP65_11610 [Planctomycetota bacterium]|nr:MAG: hypothetical protein DRP65_11610 [Planctomycetota bacterium]